MGEVAVNKLEQHRLFGWLVAGVYTLLLVVLYRTTLPYLLGMWDKEDFNYCWFVLPIALYLAWEKRATLAAVPSRLSWNFLLPMAVAIGLFALGELGGEYTALFLSLWLMVVALLWLRLGWAKLRLLAFPLLFSLTMFPPPNIIYNNLTLKLKLVSSAIGVTMLQLLGLSAYREGNLIDLGFTQLQVVDACSGLRYVFPLAVLAILLVYHMRGPFWKKVLLVAASLPLAILTNSLRIASVGLLYPSMGAQAAEGFFHDFSGWLIFMTSLAMLLGVMWVLNREISFGGWVLGFLGKRGDEKAGAGERGLGVGETMPQSRVASPSSIARLQSPASSTGPLIVAALLLLGGTVAFSQSIRSVEVRPERGELAAFPLEVGEWQGQRGALEPSVLQVLHLADYAMIDYVNPQGETVNLYVAYNDNQRKGESSHSPASCLPGTGWVFNDSGLSTLPLSWSNGAPLTISRAFMEKSGSRMLTYYWFPQRGRILTSIYQLKLYTFWDALTRGRTDGALVRVITPVGAEETVEKAEERLQGFVAAVVPKLAGYIPN